MCCMGDDVWDYEEWEGVDWQRHDYTQNASMYLLLDRWTCRRQEKAWISHLEDYCIELYETTTGAAHSQPAGG